ncbi:hypothetical protein RSOLAG1IB_11354 [Rhizoctonia solani AG-1 IB]|uniref:Uncharacterized protein n=1 Tax=Thanatephorus cucumeris (strain AG1-IB / isolate 7/3/14) TaxID=1108050 RepID=A0A0B7FB06_THACB|nr:hypothetical protein RSOLAG1IB_11354 [Rhizoctonia solani AG-1 IB]
MSERSDETKVPVLPPSAPRTSALKSHLHPLNRPRAQSLMNPRRESSPASGRHVRSSSVYPTPDSTRKRTSAHSRRHSFALRGRVQVLELENPQTSNLDLRNVHDPNPEDSDNPTETITPKRKPTSRIEAPALSKRVESSDEDGGAYSAMGEDDAGVAGEDEDGSQSEADDEADSDSGSDSDLDEEKQEDEDKGLSSPRKQKGPVAEKLKSSPRTPSRSTSTKSVKRTKVLDEGNSAVKGHQKAVIASHALKSILDLCALKQANDAGKLEARFDDAGKPVWGQRALDLIHDKSRWDPADTEYLRDVSDDKWRTAVKGGVFSSMLCTWKKYQGEEGEGAKWENKRKAQNRRLIRKAAKATKRTTALKKWRQDAKGYEFVGDPGFQSSEYSDPEDNSRRVVREHKYRTKKLVEFLGALDAAYQDGKQRSGNQKVTRWDFEKVNGELPKLKKERIPAWAVDEEWKRENPKLAKQSAKRIDSDLDKIPHPDDLDDLIYQYTPEPREYLQTSTLTSPLESDTQAVGSTAPATPIILGPAIELGRPLGNIPPVPAASGRSNVPSVHDHLSTPPQIATPSAQVFAPGPHNEEIQPLYTMGSSTAHVPAPLGYGAPAVPQAPVFARSMFLPYPQQDGPGPMPLGLPAMGYQPRYMHMHAEGEAGAYGPMQAHFSIDPALQTEVQGHSHTPNHMPPPPELHEQEATAVAVQSEPAPPNPARSKKQRPATKPRTTRSRKSKALIDDSGEEAGAIPGPSQPPRKSRAQPVKKINVSFRGA